MNDLSLFLRLIVCHPKQDGGVHMQISRHWRMNSLRYRLQGVRFPNGEVSLQAKTQNKEGDVLAIALAIVEQLSTGVVNPETTVEGGRKRTEIGISYGSSNTRR